MAKTASRGTFKITAYPGDFKTLLAFDLAKADTVNLAGFTIQVAPQDGKAQPYYLVNSLRFPSTRLAPLTPPNTPTSSLDTPFQKFRWLHVPGQFHQGTSPFQGIYRYDVTPHYFDGKGSLLALDSKKTAPLSIAVQPLKKQALTLGFTRGF